ncbi:hypothetical protein [Treponema socranskii]|uniref:hypothetical protein n=1 Tax=Treponema socranskii TaxID=53419 RepID=UPI0028726F0B|nr:hypothetical protein [Treponema socranskii]MDR9858022.1 hypothetical protein [Treponema socranskii]
MSFFSIDKKIRCFVLCAFMSGALLFPQAAGSKTSENETLVTQSVPSATLSFKYKKGDSYRTLSKVHEDVFVNGKENHHAEIVTRISAKIVDVHNDGSGVCEATFMSSEDSTSSANGAHFSWGDEYKSVFTRSARGIYSMDDVYFMPVVRDCPIFPETPVKPGDTWSAEGHEAHDLRRTFALQKPFKVPFTASYRYKELLKIPTAGFSTLSTSGTICISKVRKSMYGREIFPLELRNCSIARKSRWVIRIKRSTGTTSAAKSITIMKILKSSSKPITATRSRFKGQRKLK